MLDSNYRLSVQVYTLADRLKYFDTVFDRNADTFPDDGGEFTDVASVGDQQWLQNLLQTVNQFGVSERLNCRH